jgi:hypothetical protein
MKEKIMDDKNLMQHIDRLADEEHDLFERESHEKLTDAERERLQHLQTLLDQCWDLLRQRRAKREFGQDPGEAQLRSEKIIKGYSG